jgi:hypothetical protein
MADSATGTNFARLCVFCGSSTGADPKYRDAARELGRALADDGIAVVFGGGKVGLMGLLADAALERGGEVIGVIPRALATKELAHDGVTKLHVVESMHERKALMADLSDGFIAMPGGLGTLEELFEVLTWAQLGIHSKPCGLLNVGGYYDLLVAFLDFTVTQQLLKPEHRNIIVVDADHRRLLGRMREYESPITEKWIRDDER